MSLHYHKIVQNEWFGYPEEWFPSVSATIGDRFPERSFFMLFIALTSGPRFALVGLWYLLTAKPGRSLPKVVGYFGVFRTFTCGGWTYVTSTDNHDWHDIFMISYLVATIPWMFGCLALSPANAKAIQYRKYVAGAFFGTIIPLVYFFIRHKVHRVPGGMFLFSLSGFVMRNPLHISHTNTTQRTPSTPFSSGHSFCSMSPSTRSLPSILTHSSLS